MLYSLPTKATIKRNQINLIEEKNCEDKMKETELYQFSSKMLMKIIFVNINFVAAFEKEVLANYKKDDASVFHMYAI